MTRRWFLGLALAGLGCSGDLDLPMPGGDDDDDGLETPGPADGPVDGEPIHVLRCAAEPCLAGEGCDMTEAAWTALEELDAAAARNGLAEVVIPLGASSTYMDAQVFVDFELALPSFDAQYDVAASPTNLAAELDRVMSDVVSEDWRGPDLTVVPATAIQAAIDECFGPGLHTYDPCEDNAHDLRVRAYETFECDDVGTATVDPVTGKLVSCSVPGRDDGCYPD